MNRRTPVSKGKYGIATTRNAKSRQSKIESLQPRPRLLIFCEGEKTEPNYFRSFRVTNDIIGEGYNTLSLVQEAEKYNEKHGPFDQVWCVFDRDSFPPDHFDNSIARIQAMEQQRFREAYSNQAFELWFLLHFEYLHSGIDRSSYWRKLTGHLGQEYRKGDERIYDILAQKGNENLAFKYAQQLRQTHPADAPASERNPETTVDHLVAELRKIQKRRSDRQ